MWIYETWGEAALASFSVVTIKQARLPSVCEHNAAMPK